jgi:drug/metabolite transporter (DMT)-like permease
VGKKQLVQWHRLGGAATLLLALAVAAMCVLGERYAYYSPRVQAHAVMGVLAILVLAVKAVITNRFRRYLRHALVLGTVAGLLVLGTFIASALWYFVQGV